MAVDGHWGIGKDGKLLFRIPEDMKHFRRLTTGKVVVMGRKTFESLPGGKPLKDRTNIVLSADPVFSAQGAIVCRSIQELKETVKQYDTNDVFVIGGQKVFEELLEYCRYAYVTRYDGLYEADRRFPDIGCAEGWRPVEALMRGSHEGCDFTINRYENGQCKPL